MDAPSGRRGPGTPDTVVHPKGLERLTQASSFNPVALAGAGLGVGAFSRPPGWWESQREDFRLQSPLGGFSSVPRWVSAALTAFS